MTIRHRALHLIFPPQCLLCGDLVQRQGGLCGPCWRDTPFIIGLSCDQCGAPVMGPESSHAVSCEDCRATPRSWRKGRSVMLYEGGGRRLVLGLKHADRLDLAPALAEWMVPRAQALLHEETLIAPVPAHWRRLFKRRYNQAAVLANALARQVDRPVCPDLLTRVRSTETQDGKGADARHANVSDAFSVTKRHRAELAGREVLLVDDVLTSGATLEACTTACLDAGAEQVCVIALARVTRHG